MGTRSTISILQKDQTVVSTYCHWDGYLSHNGSILQEHYKSAKKIKELLSLGHISSLGKDITPAPGVVHTFDQRAPGVTVYYGRDRGDVVEVSTYNNLKKYMDTADFQGYDYLFNESNKTWYVYHSEERKFDRLSLALKNEDNEDYQPVLFTMEEELAKREVKKLENTLTPKNRQKKVLKV